MSADSLIFGALKSVGVVQRDGFTMPAFDPETGRPTGSVGVHEVAAELIEWLDLCRAHGTTDCAECAPKDTDDGS
ncbi:hypothetical protein [Actinomadura montaniterrae]|uniref:Uncharacterized protein n=1 Tax=Actinomadura montaniterrae TaxID=1803903 RepID=A0A6L3VYY8_9ACTN|nr:hypothetical protein [Actinomadura montaniterrae]KAB2379236.1 hypothetical protein F9B16_21195 [Actinomadura montaniterrae]